MNMIRGCTTARIGAGTRSRRVASTRTFSACRSPARWRSRETKTGRATNVLHTFYELGDGSYLAFFEAPDMPFEFKRQHDFDLHIALEVDEAVLQPMLSKARQARP